MAITDVPAASDPAPDASDSSLQTPPPRQAHLEHTSLHRIRSKRESGPSLRTSSPGWLPLIHRGWTGYVVAIALVLLVATLTRALEPLLQPTLGVLFYAAITLIAWYGGLGPALVATLLSILSLDYFFLEPRGRVFLNGRDVAPLIIFGAAGAFISWLSDSHRRTQARALRHADALDEARTQLESQAAELERSRDFLEEAQRSAQVGSWERDFRTGEITWSDEMYRVYGAEPGTPVEREAMRRFVHPDDRPRIDDVLAETVRTGSPFTLEHRIMRPDGTLRWVRARGRPVKNERGEVVRMVGSAQDITDTHRAQESQRLLAEASEALASSLDYNVTLTTLANLCVASIADWVSIAIGDDTGRHSNLVVAHRDPERVQWAREWNRLHPPRSESPTGVPQVLRTGKSEFYPAITKAMLQATTTSEEERRVLQELNIRSVMIVPMRARGRTLGAITFIASDSPYRYTAEDLGLAERLASRAAIAIDNARLYEDARVARAAAEIANRAKMDFLAAMSHELRTPINAIAGYTQLLSMGIHGPISAPQLEALQRLERSQKHLLALVEDVLTFARVEAGKMQYQFADASVDQIVREAADVIAPQAEAKKIAWQYLGADPNLSIRTDAERLNQIVVNLLTNAVKFTESGGQVTVSVLEEPDAASIVVSDTGVGIPADRLESIFEPFVQLEQAKNKRASGMGLGLAISRDLARAMGGEILVTSHVGRGSTFTLRLPRGGP